MIEKQANMLCSYFLIPTGQMKKAYNRLMAKGCSKNIVKEMAAIFGVAPTTMQIRLYEHGLL
jgi:Zn-dependent peptidase ImmA (M78 family)